MLRSGFVLLAAAALLLSPASAAVAAPALDGQVLHLATGRAELEPDAPDRARDGTFGFAHDPWDCESAAFDIAGDGAYGLQDGSFTLGGSLTTSGYPSWTLSDLAAEFEIIGGDGTTVSGTLTGLADTGSRVSSCTVNEKDWPETFNVTVVAFVAYEAELSVGSSTTADIGTASLELQCAGTVDQVGCSSGGIATLRFGIGPPPPQPSGSLYGTVTANGQPVEGATIVMYTDDNLRESLGFATTDATGHYEAVGIAPGAYVVEVYPPPPSGGTFWFEASRQVAILDEPVNEDFALDTAPSTTVSGKVKLSDGTVVPGAAIAVCWGDHPCYAPAPETGFGGPTVRTTYSGADGAYEFAGIPAIAVDFAVWDPDYGASFVVASQFQPNPAQDEIDLILTRGPASIEGHFRHADADPVVSGRVYWRFCESPAEQQHFVRRTSSDGSFAIRGLPQAPGCIAITGFDESTFTVPDEVEVEYTINLTAGVTLVLPPIAGSKVRLEVTDTRGAPVAGAYVYAYSEAGDEFDALTGDNGVAVLRGAEPDSVLTGWVTTYEPVFRRERFEVTVGTTTVVLPVTLAALSQDTDGSTELGGTPTATDPVSAAISNPFGGTVSIVEGATLAPSGGYRFLGRALTIEAEPATVEDPIQLTFTIHSSLLGGVDPQSIVVTRDGQTAGNCTSSAVVAEPDPCVYSRVVDGDGNLTMVVLTSHASLWLLAAPEATGPSADAAIEAVGALPAGAFKAPGHRSALTSRLSDVNDMLTAGNERGAAKHLAKMRRQVDGCGTKADKDDWIVSCPAQLDLRSLLDELITQLGG
jgi:hypothetical protein